MAQSDKAKKNFEEIKKSTKETMDFIKEMSKDFPDVGNYAKRLAATFSDAKKLSGDQLKVLKSTNDITREILGNRKNIHKESFNLCIFVQFLVVLIYLYVLSYKD